MQQGDIYLGEFIAVQGLDLAKAKTNQNEKLLVTECLLCVRHSAAQAPYLHLLSCNE